MASFRMALTSWWRVIHKQRWIALCIFLAIFFSTLFFISRQARIYSAQAMVQVGSPKIIGEFLISRFRDERLDMGSELRFIRGPEVTEEVVKRLALAPEWASLEEIKGFGHSLSGRIKTRLTKKSDIIEIEVKAANPEEAARLANATAQAYADMSLKKKTEKARAFGRYVEKQLMVYKGRLDESEQLLADFKEKEGDVSGQKMVERTNNRLRALNYELFEFLQLYTEENLSVKELRAQIETTEKKLKVLVGKDLEFQRLKRESKYNKKKYEYWKRGEEAARITEEDQRSDVIIINKAVAPKAAGGQNWLLNGLIGALIGVIAAISSAFFIESAGTSLKTIEDMENFTKLPVLGAIPYLALKGEKKRHWQEVFYKRRVDKLSQLKEQLIINYSSQSPTVESYRSLRTSIESKALKKGSKALLVTSAGPGEGKPITCVNLAVIFAQEGLKVLLIDADLRRSIIHKLFDLEKEPGLTNCLDGTVKWKDSLRTITDVLISAKEWDNFLKTPGIDNLRIITCGRSALNPAELLNSEKVKPLIDELKQNFDLVLIDSPPVLPIADTAILGPKLDGIIFVYQTGVVAKEALHRIKEALEGVGARIEGIVLNNTSRELEAYPPYAYYRYKYYDGKKD